MPRLSSSMPISCFCSAQSSARRNFCRRTCRFAGRRQPACACRTVPGTISLSTIRTTGPFGGMGGSAPFSARILISIRLKLQHGRLLILLWPSRQGSGCAGAPPAAAECQSYYHGWGSLLAQRVKRPSGQICASPSTLSLEPRGAQTRRARHSSTPYLPGTLTIAFELVERRFRAAACRR